MEMLVIIALFALVLFFIVIQIQLVIALTKAANAAAAYLDKKRETIKDEER